MIWTRSRLEWMPEPGQLRTICGLREVMRRGAISETAPCLGAECGTRTHTSFRTTVFETVASASSANPAHRMRTIAGRYPESRMGCDLHHAACSLRRVYAFYADPKGSLYITRLRVGRGDGRLMRPWLLPACRDRHRKQRGLPMSERSERIVCQRALRMPELSVGEVRA